MELGSCGLVIDFFDNSSKGDHDWARETLEISGEWESDHSPELRVSTVFISGKQAALISFSAAWF